jgi:uncharacterized protein DUF6098
MEPDERAAADASAADLVVMFESACLRDLDSLAELEALIGNGRPLFVRFSKGIEADRNAASIDYESGLELPGLSVNPLDPEPWWTRDRQDWLARQLCNYLHLQENADEQRCAWVLTGEATGRGSHD